MSHQTSTSRTLVEICEPVFGYIQLLQAPDKLGDAQCVQTQIRARFDEMRHGAIQAGIATHDIDLAAFALMAFADETIAETRWPERIHWPFLQVSYYNSHRAGEQFFEHLLKLSGADHSPAVWKTAARASMLEIYYLCLLLGFRGAWALCPTDQLRLELAAIERQIRARTVGPLAPKIVAKPYGSSRRATARRWMWGAIVLHMVLIAALLLFFLGWIGIS